MAQKKNARRRNGFTGPALLCCALLAALMYLSGGVKEYRGTQGPAGEAAASRARLDAMQAQAPVDLDAEIKRQYRETLQARRGIMIDDMEAEQQKIINLDTWNKADFARWFDGTAIVGDSIINQVRSFGWLDAPVFSKGGIHLSVDLPLLDTIEAAQPSVIFLCFGMNDVGVFKDRVDRYVERYTNVIKRLRKALPDTVSYVHATLPVTDACVAENSDFQYIDRYNAAMEQACPDIGAYFIDSGFILRAHPELYSADGRHPRTGYYPLWLTYLADVTGLNHE